jgi:hypothetical protein
MTANGNIQIQADFSGNWRTVSHVMNNSQYITHAMKSVSKMHPTKRIRAVDSNGRLVDML